MTVCDDFISSLLLAAMMMLFMNCTLVTEKESWTHGRMLLYSGRPYEPKGCTLTCKYLKTVSCKSKKLKPFEILGCVLNKGTPGSFIKSQWFPLVVLPAGCWRPGYLLRHCTKCRFVFSTYTTCRFVFSTYTKCRFVFWTYPKSRFVFSTYTSCRFVLRVSVCLSWSWLQAAGDVVTYWLLGWGLPFWCVCLTYIA